MICGVDVSSKSLDARIGQDGPTASFTNDPKGITALAEFCQDHKVHLVAMEATGG
jgi:transposase